MFVVKEMEKNNYIAKAHNPIKKRINKKGKTIDVNSKSIHEYNSRMGFNIKNESKIKEKSKNKTKKFKNKIKKLTKKLAVNKKKKSNQPIIIFNYKNGNNYYKCNDNSKDCSSKAINKKTNNKYKTLNKRTIVNKNTIKLNKEKSFPGYYNLIQINANNSLKNKPPNSKFILDNYTYEEAIKYENRDFWRIYFICLLSKEKILNTFFFKSPLESRAIRITIFILYFSCELALNTLFYFNDKISDKYNYEGDSLYLYILVNNITICIFSALITYFIIKPLNFLTNSNDKIELLFREEEKKMRKNKQYKVDTKRKKYIYDNILKVFKIMKIKIVCFSIIEMLIMTFFLYYITAFCEVYRDTQISLLYDSFISFILSIPIELLIAFIISLLYIIALKLKIKFIYNIVLFSYKLR